MGMNICGLCQTKEQNEWGAYDKYFSWFNDSESREVFEILLAYGNPIDDIKTWCDIIQQAKENYGIENDNLKNAELFGFRTLQLDELIRLKPKVREKYFDSFVDELQHIYSGDPKKFRIIYCFDT